MTVAQDNMDEATAEPEGDLRISFRDAQQQPQRGRPDQDGVRSAARSLSRASSRRSSRSRLPAQSPYSGVQIEYRTMSIHVSESRRDEPDSAEAVNKTVKREDEEYFSNLSYHELDPDQVCQQLNVSLSQGLSDDAAAARLQRDGPNVLPQPKTNYLKKLLSYVFGGFCSVLWVGVVIFFVCWRPLSNPPSATNLALAILVLMVIMLQATFNAFQDWSTQRTMKSIVDLLPSETRVFREGRLISVPASHLSPATSSTWPWGTRSRPTCGCSNTRATSASIDRC